MTVSGLHPDALADLAKSGLSLDTIARAGLKSVSRSDLKTCPIPGVVHALAFPYHALGGTLTDFARWKLFYRDNGGDSPKYWQPAGSDPLLFLPPLVDWPSLANDPAQPLLISEGEKKSLAACQLDLPCIGVAGVWNWRAKLDNGERLVLPGFDQFVWKGRTVELVPDSDVWRPEKEQALQGFYALGMYLIKCGARVRFVHLPEANGVKCGLDDFLAQPGAFKLETFRGCQRVPLDDPQFKTLAAWHQKWERRQRSGGDQGLTKTLADEILKQDHVAVDAGGLLYVFERGCYRPHGEAHVARRVKHLLECNGDSAKWSSHRAREVTEYLRVDAPRLWERPTPDTLNLENGLLDLQTGTLRPHEPAHRSPVQLPISFDPAATCPLWERFIARVLPEDCQTFPFELIASAMRGDVSDQKAVLLVGAGENGKSTLLDALIRFLGRENVSGLPLQRLETDKFSVVRLLGKLANVCADLPSDHLTSTSTFKAITGGDRLTAERKFQGSFEFTPHARLIFSTNHYPQSKDASHAFFRRWLVIPFDAVIDPKERIPDLASRLAEARELSGVLNRALAVLPSMRRRGGFSVSESTQAALMEFREMTDPLAAWLDRFTILDPDQVVSRKDLTIRYNAHTEQAGRPPMTAKAFCQAVRRLRPTVGDAQRMVCGQMQWVFLGLGLRNPQGSDSRGSHDSHHSFQISLEVGNKEEERDKNLKRGNSVNPVNGTTNLTNPPEPCFTCQQVRFWRSIHGVMVCAACHPPTKPELVAEWIGREAP